jgi:hypothetical protein
MTSPDDPYSPRGPPLAPTAERAPKSGWAWDRSTSSHQACNEVARQPERNHEMKRRITSMKLRRGFVVAILVVTTLLLSAAPALAWANLNGYGCRISGGQVHAWVDVTSGGNGTAYVNIYKRSSSGNLLVARTTKYGNDIFLHAYEPYSSGSSYFATMGFNGWQGNVSAGIDCKRY